MLQPETGRVCSVLYKRDYETQAEKEFAAHGRANTSYPADRRLPNAHPPPGIVGLYKSEQRVLLTVFKMRLGTRRSGIV